MMSSSPNPDWSAKESIENWLEDFGDSVYAYALARVENEHVADELVQETYLAAFTNFDRFQAKSTPKTWLIAILRNKIIEHYRRRTRKRQQSLDGDLRMPFDHRGVWDVALLDWPRRPEEGLENQEFWHTFQKCLEKLPANAAEVFMLRVLDELETDKICKTLKISSSNMAVRLHRARLMLRDCLEQNWFGSD